jgi:hypothetical protein
MAGPTTTLSDEDLQQMMDLIKGADSVELKLTIHESVRADAARALGIDPLDSQMRQVFFFDTPELALNAAGVVVRARRRQNEEGDTVVKLRPVVVAGGIRVLRLVQGRGGQRGHQQCRQR